MTQEGSVHSGTSKPNGKPRTNFLFFEVKMWMNQWTVIEMKTDILPIDTSRICQMNSQLGTGDNRQGSKRHVVEKYARNLFFSQRIGVCPHVQKRASVFLTLIWYIITNATIFVSSLPLSITYSVEKMEKIQIPKNCYFRFTFVILNFSLNIT